MYTNSPFKLHTFTYRETSFFDSIAQEYHEMEQCSRMVSSYYTPFVALRLKSKQ